MGCIVADFISFADLAPTFLAAAGVECDVDFSGRSLLPLIESSRSGRIEPSRDHVLTGRERHIHCRPNTVGYPVRSIRTDQYHYMRNYAPDRWPVGDPLTDYGDTDAGATKQYMIDHRDDEGVRELFRLSFGKRLAEELYDIEVDPYCLRNLADQEECVETRKALSERLEAFLLDENDPRVLGYGDLFDSYPYFQGPYPWHDVLPGFKDIGHYNKEAQERAEQIKARLNSRDNRRDRRAFESPGYRENHL